MKAKFALLRPEISGFRAPYPVSEIAANGISPNGEWAFILGFSTDDRTSNPPNCLVMRSRPGQIFYLPTEIGSSSVKRGGLNGVVRWAKDSSAVICFRNMDKPIGANFVNERSAYEIYVVPIINELPGKPTALETEILKASHPDFAKALDGKMKFPPCFYSTINDQGLDDDLTFNASNLLVIDCYCTNFVRESDNDMSWETWTAHVTGLWDPVHAKFVKVAYEPVTLGK